MSPKCNWRWGTLFLSLPKKNPKKNPELLRKQFLTQIVNVYQMEKDYIQNFEAILSSSCLILLAAPFIQK